MTLSYLNCKKHKGKVNAVFVNTLDTISADIYEYISVRKQLSAHEVSIFSATEPITNYSEKKHVETILFAFAELDKAVRTGKLPISTE